jgi:hypothetical protein
MFEGFKISLFVWQILRTIYQVQTNIGVILPKAVRKIDPKIRYPICFRIYSSKSNSYLRSPTQVLRSSSFIQEMLRHKICGLTFPIKILFRMSSLFVNIAISFASVKRFVFTLKCQKILLF